MRTRRTFKVSKERAKEIILRNEPSLTKEMVDKYTDSEIKEWMVLLDYRTDF